MIMWFSSFILLRWNITFIDFQMLNQNRINCSIMLFNLLYTAELLKLFWVYMCPCSREIVMNNCVIALSTFGIRLCRLQGMNWKPFSSIFGKNLWGMCFWWNWKEKPCGPSLLSNKIIQFFYFWKVYLHSFF